MRADNNIYTRYLQVAEYTLWDRFVDDSIEGTIFHKSVWLKSISTWQNLNFSIAACFKGGELIGGMAFTWKKKFGRIPVIQLPFKTLFFGPVIAQSKAKHQSKSESHQQAVVQSLTGFLMSEYQMFYAKFPPSVIDIRNYSWNGFQTGIHYTYLADLNPENDILSSFDHSVRKQINKGEKLNYIFHADNHENFISLAWELEQKSFNRQDFKLVYASKAAFMTFVSELIDMELAQVYSLYLENTPVASRIVLLDHPKSKVYDWLSGADKEHLSTGLNQLLMYRVLKELQKSDLSFFDFGGAGTSSIARYKSTYNFPLVPMYSVSKSRSIARLGMAIKNFIQ